MLVERSMDPGWLSNAYLVADEEGGTAVYVDSGAPLEPLLEAAERWRVQPGHAEDHIAFVVNDELCFSGDILFKDAVGGGSDVPAIRSSVMDGLMKLPPETRVLPGHTEETTIGREWEENT